MTPARVLLVLVAVLLGSAALLMLADPDPVADAAASPAAGPISFAQLPSSGAGEGTVLLARSPFASDRSPYARSSLTEAPPPQPADVRLVAVFRAGAQPRATLRVDGVEITVGVGDATVLGSIVAIEADAIIVGDRRMSLFE